MRRALYASAGELDLALREFRIDDKEAKAIWESLKHHLPVFGLFQADRPSKVEDAEVQDPMKLAVKRALMEVEQQLEEVKEQVRQHALKTAEATVAKLKEIDPELAGRLEAKSKAEPNWGKLFTIELDDDRGIPINKRRSGVRRLILLSFFRSEVERKRSEAGGSRPMLFAIEEPETAQHPTNQRIIVEALKALAAAGDQVIVTTHDPALAGLLPLSSIRFLDRAAETEEPRMLPSSDLACHCTGRL